MISKECVTKGQEGNVRTKRTRLPWSQLLIVYFIQFSEPITATVIYPFINEFVRGTGITGGDERKTGYFAGMIDSVFFFAEAATVVIWGMASDLFGRRPILIWGPLGLSVTTLLFGMSTKFWCLVIFRCLQGSFNGNIGIAKAVIGELTDSTNVADAFAVLPFMWCMGEILGPAIGGLLSRPADIWPHSPIGKIEYLVQHPYFLPCLAVSFIAFLSFLAGFLGLKETSRTVIQRKREQGKKQNEKRSPDVIADDLSSPNTASVLDCEVVRVEDSTESTQTPGFRTLLTRDIAVVLVNQWNFTFLSMSASILIPLTWSTSIEHGGLGFSPYRIGLTLTIYGIATAVVQLKFLSPVIRLLGPQRLYVVSAASLIVHFGCFPLEIVLARRVEGVDWKVWVVIVAQLTAEMMSYSAYGSMQIMVQGVSPSRSALGVMNGMAQAVASVAKSFAPVVSSSLQALSLQRNLAGGYAVYYILLSITVCSLPLTLLLPRQLKLD